MSSVKNPNKKHWSIANQAVLHWGSLHWIFLPVWDCLGGFKVSPCCGWLLGWFMAFGLSHNWGSTHLSKGDQPTIRYWNNYKQTSRTNLQRLAGFSRCSNEP